MHGRETRQATKLKQGRLSAVLEGLDLRTTPARIDRPADQELRRVA